MIVVNRLLEVPMAKDNWIVYLAIALILVMTSYFIGRREGFDKGVDMMQPFIDSSRESQDNYFNKWIDCQYNLIRSKYAR